MRIDPCDLAVRLFMFAKLYAKRKLSQNFLLGGKFRKNFPWENFTISKLYVLINKVWGFLEQSI